MVAAIGPPSGERWQRAPEWDDLAGQLAHGVALMAVAAEISGPGKGGFENDVSAWLERIERAGHVLNAKTLTRERGISPDQGMELSL